MKRTSLIGIAIVAAGLLSLAAPAMAAVDMTFDNTKNIELQLNTDLIAAPVDHPSPADLIIYVDSNLDDGALFLPINSDDALAKAATIGNPSSGLEKMTSDGGLPDFASSGSFVLSKVFLNQPTSADIGLASGALSPSVAT